MIPKTAWFGSLARVLSQASWRCIKAPYIEAADGRCRICGEIAPRDPVRNAMGNTAIEAHEIWGYHDAPGGGPGIHRLDDILALCGSCHMMFHLGFALRKGLDSYVLARFQYFNMWGDKTAQPVVDDCFEVWKRRSAREWIADVSLAETGEPVTIKASQARFAVRLTGISRRVGRGGAVTRTDPPAIT